MLNKFINDYNLPRGDGKELPDDTLRLAEEKARAERAKAESDAQIKASLNDKEFLVFLQKNPDAVENANNDDYLKQKMEVFVEVGKVKKEIGKFISLQSRGENMNTSEPAFIAGLEQIAIDHPKDFANFSKVVSKYLESVERSKELELAYREIASALGLEGDFSHLSDEDKKELVNRVHEKFAEDREEAEKQIEKEKSSRSLASRFRKKARADYHGKITGLNQKIQALKQGEEKLDRNALSTILGEISGIKSGLEDNKAFEFVRIEFDKQLEDRILNAMLASDEAAVSAGVVSLDKLVTGVFVGSSRFDRLKSDIATFARDGLDSATFSIFENKDATLDFFEKEVEAMRQKGLSLGLTSRECNKQIAEAFRIKIADLEDKQNQGQNRIKIILAKRILINLE